jgi:Protein of unknown function (DUF1353)
MTRLDRRSWLALATTATIGACFGVLRSAVGSAQIRSANTIIEEWMDDWMGGTKLPVGTLHLSRFKDPVYFLTKPISWQPNADQSSYDVVTVPKGFVTDFASIPRVFWSVLRPDGDYTYPAIIHDFLYWQQHTQRETADRIFLFSMQDFDIDQTTATIIYNAVRLGGGVAWRHNSSDKTLGGRRVLKKFPQDPRISWHEWKEKPDVFADQE